MAKTLNEVLATARKSLPTPDGTRELLVQALEHLKDVKDTADGAPKVWSYYRDVEFDDNFIKDYSNMKNGDIIIVIDADNFTSEVIFPFIFAPNYADDGADYLLMTSLAVPTPEGNNQFLSIGIQLDERAEHGMYVDEVATNIVDVGTKLYKHVIGLGALTYSASFSQTTQGGQLEIISTTEEKVTTLQDLSTLLQNSINCYIRVIVASTSPHTFRFRFEDETSLRFNNNSSDGPYSGGSIMITAISSTPGQHYTVTPL